MSRQVNTDLSGYKGQDVLVTGGLGFIGSNLCHRLVDLGSKVTIIDALIPGQGGDTRNIDSIERDVDVHIADLRSRQTVNRLVQGKNIIFNLAGNISHLESIRDPVLDMKLNCQSHLTLLEACRKHNPEARVVYTATRAQYGRPLYLPVDEKHPQVPVDVNGVNKMAGEAYHFIFARMYGIPVCSLRLTNTYGPRQPARDDSHGFISWLLKLALAGRCMPIYGDGRQKRDLTYVDDVVEALLMAGLAPAAVGEAFNVGTGKAVSILDVARLLLEITEAGSYELVPFPERDGKIEVGDYCADYSKIAATLGWQPRVDLEEGLKRTVAFFATKAKSCNQADGPPN